VEKVKRFQSGFSILLASIAVAVSYEFRQRGILIPGVPSLVLAATAFVIGSAIARRIAIVGTSFRWVRSVIMGPDFIEGYWRLTTRDLEAPNSITENNESSLQYPGILYLNYSSETNDYMVSTSRIDKDGVLFVVNSEIAHIRKDKNNIRYLNYFRLTHPGPKIEHGISHGEFSRTDDATGRPNFFEAQIFTGGESVRRQSAIRVPYKEVRKLRANHGNEWIRAYLQSDHEYQENSDAGSKK